MAQPRENQSARGRGLRAGRRGMPRGASEGRRLRSGHTTSCGASAERCAPRPRPPPGPACAAGGPRPPPARLTVAPGGRGAPWPWGALALASALAVGAAGRAASGPPRPRARAGGGAGGRGLLPGAAESSSTKRGLQILSTLRPSGSGSSPGSFDASSEPTAAEPTSPTFAADRGTPVLTACRPPPPGWTPRRLLEGGGAAKRRAAGAAFPRYGAGGGFVIVSRWGEVEHQKGCQCKPCHARRRMEAKENEPKAEEEAAKVRRPPRPPFPPRHGGR